MRKNIFVILLLAAIFVFVGTISQSVKAEDDPVEFIKNSKTPVYLHSLAGDTLCIPGISDSLVHERPTQVSTRWHSLYPPPVYCHTWHVVDQYENGTPGLNPSDWLKLEHTVTHNWVWVHVEDVKITLKLKKRATGDNMYVEFERGWKEVGPDFVNFAIYPPVECDTLHEIWPEYSRRFHLSSWLDSGPPFAQLSCSDTIDLTEWWKVKSFVVPPAGDCTLKVVENSGIEKTLKWVSGTSCNGAMTNPVSNTFQQISEPGAGTTWHIAGWRDTQPNGNMDGGDYIAFDPTYWHVEDVAIDILVQSGPVPRTPTMTQWGVIILVALIVGSAVLIMLRKRRATVPV